MAQIKEFYDRFTDETVYPSTVTQAVMCPDGRDLESRLNTDRRDIESQLSNIYAEELISPESFPEIDELTRDELKKGLFIDMWNRRGNYNIKPLKKDFLFVAKYDPDNAPDADHPFYINKLWLTYEEALDVYEVPTAFGVLHNLNGTVAFSRAKTVFPMKGNTFSTLENYCDFCHSIQTIRVLDYYIVNNLDNPETTSVRCLSTRNFAVQCLELREVIGILELSEDFSKEHFYSTGVWPKLETIWLKGVKYNIPNAKSWIKLKVECWQFIVDNAANTTEITICVHPEVYAKLTDENNAEWHRVLTEAVARNINFATV